MNPAAHALDEAICDRDRDQFLASLDDERLRMLEAIGRLLDATDDDREQAHLRQQREQTWDLDEQMRGTAERNWRDCVRHAGELE